MNIAFVGDVFPGGDMVRVGGYIDVSAFYDADVRVANLEGPISDSDCVADKSTLYVGGGAVDRLKELKIDVVSLANNHIQDKCDVGIADTIELLKENEIGCFGAGLNIDKAQRPYWVSKDIALFGYCECQAPYLNQVQVASRDQPGVNPLTPESIAEDLHNLSPGQKAILFLHWGREHVMFPPEKNLRLAKRLLKDERVALIISSHPHVIQGYVKYKSKKAYMSLGNFLFPNFHVKPPVQIYYPSRPAVRPVTKQYHRVFKPTYKKWKTQNRTSVIVAFNSETDYAYHIPVVQDNDSPTVRSAGNIVSKYVMMRVELLACCYQVPSVIYKIVESVSRYIVGVKWGFISRVNMAMQMESKVLFKKIMHRMGFIE